MTPVVAPDTVRIEFHFLGGRRKWKAENNAGADAVRALRVDRAAVTLDDMFHD